MTGGPKAFEQSLPDNRNSIKEYAVHISGAQIKIIINEIDSII